MLKVIKRDGRVIDFNEENIKTSIANSASDSDIQITKKELELIAHAVEKTIIKMRGVDGVTSTFEIRNVIVRELNEFGYKGIARDFERQEKERSYP
jgi:transcriptional regulator NrdR family protein